MTKYLLDSLLGQEIGHCQNDGAALRLDHLQ